MTTYTIDGTTRTATTADLGKVEAAALKACGFPGTYTVQWANAIGPVQHNSKSVDAYDTQIVKPGTYRGQALRSDRHGQHVMGTVNVTVTVGE